MSKTIVVNCDRCGKEMRREVILSLEGLGDMEVMRELEGEITDYMEGKFPKNITHLCDNCLKGYNKLIEKSNKEIQNFFNV